MRYEKKTRCLLLEDLQKAIQKEMQYDKPKKAFNALYGCWGKRLLRKRRYASSVTFSLWKKRGYLTMTQAIDFLTYCFNRTTAEKMLREYDDILVPHYIAKQGK